MTRYAIDRFMVLRNTCFVEGWCATRDPAGLGVSILHRGNGVETRTDRMQRPELVADFGRKAAAGGFAARAFLDPGTRADELSVRLTAPELDVTIEHPAREFVDPVGLWQRFVGEVREHRGRVLEIGARARSGTTHRATFEATNHYVGADIAAGPNVDIVVDAHALSATITDRFDFVFSISTFEHLLMPWKAVLEINRILAPGGLVFTQSHQTWPVHDAPWDFWRFSDNSWRGLFNAHTGFEVVAATQSIPALIAAGFCDGPLRDLDYQPAFLASSCIARKIGDPVVSWDADVAAVYDLTYSHGPVRSMRMLPRRALRLLRRLAARHGRALRWR